MKRYLKISVVFLCLLVFPAFAQDFGEPDLTKNEKILTAIEQNLQKNNLLPADISDDLKIVNGIQSEMSQAKLYYQDKLHNVQKRLDALGSVPESGIKEPAEIAAKRKEFTNEEENYKFKIARIELINAKTEDINALILKIRNRSLLDKILVQQTSVFQLADFGEAFLTLPRFFYNLLETPYIWYNHLDDGQRRIIKDNIIHVLLIAAIVLIFVLYLSFYIRKFFGYKDCRENPKYAEKIRAAAAMAFSYGIIPAAVIGTFLLWLKDNPLLNAGQPSIRPLLNCGLFLLLLFFLLRAAVKAVLVPQCGAWRIIKINDEKAKTLNRTLSFALVSILLIQMLLQYALKVEAGDDTIYALQILDVAAKAFGIIFTARRLAYNPEDETEAANDEQYILSTTAKLYLFTAVFSAGVLLISLAGYVRLSEFIINRFLLTLVVLGLFWLIGQIIRIMLHQILRLKFWKRKLHISPRGLVKTEFWAGFALTPLLWLAAGIAVLALWGFSVDIMLHDIRNFLLGFNIGGMRISIVSIFWGIISFFVSLFIFKSVRQSLISGNLSKVEMEESSRNSLAAGINLIGFIISAVVAIAVMGGSLSSITIIAGALSFGVGLGLQNIVSNFVSGIIIIFERPIKIGDWVVINGQEGIVKSIAMRATILEAFNKSDIIIPNSDILSSSLVNLTYSNRIGRIEIKIGVSYNSDIKLVQKLLNDIAVSTAGILSNPAPTVAFADFSDNSLVFQLNCYTANVYSRQDIANQIREKILNEFTVHNINIPTAPKTLKLISSETANDENQTIA